MKIILADDDKSIRYYMRSIIDEVIEESHEIFEAANGKKFLELCAKTMPNIAFVDINMPYLDGISAVEQAKKICPQTKFVILTAYADFSYAKRCISLEVSDYLLKPVDQETLINVFDDLKRKMCSDHSNDNFKFGHKVISLFNNPSFGLKSEGVEDKSKEIEFLYYEFFIICKDYDKYFQIIYSKISDELTNFTKGLSHTYQKSVLFHSKLGNLTLVIQSRTQEKGFINHSIHQILKHESDDFLISCLSVAEKTLPALSQSSLFITKMNSCIFANKTHRILDIKAITKDLTQDDITFLELFSNIVYSYINGNEPKFTVNIKSIQKNIDLSKLKINFQNCLDYFHNITGVTFQASKKELFFRELLTLGEGLKIKINQSSLDKVFLIKEYIDKNYMNDISITTISEIYNLTPNYTSKIFHEKIGIKFIDYLTQVRIYNAKLLLSSNNNLSIKTVASMVGYYSPRHFTNIFYKTTNMYPSDFKKTNN